MSEPIMKLITIDICWCLNTVDFKILIMYIMAPTPLLRQSQDFGRIIIRICASIIPSNFKCLNSMKRLNISSKRQFIRFALLLQSFIFQITRNVQLT